MGKGFGNKNQIKNIGGLTDGILKIEGASYKILNLITWYLRVKIGCISFSPILESFKT